ncbi:MAG: tetratricopeptide repeat protein, partial [Luteolibacter sp.]
LEEAADEQATDAMAASLAAFQKGDFAAALVSVDLALSKVPGDVAMHEFRALIFFALGRFDDSAGVLNAVLASGPGWDWTTMTGLFDSQETYIELLRKLEDYTDANPDSAAAHFVLGYHYLVLGHLEYALTLFDRVIVLEPRDTVSTQLRNLIKDAIVSDEEDAEEAPVPAKVDPDKLVGTWVSKRDEGTVKLVLTEDGKFTWTFDKGDKAGDLAGEFGVAEENQLILSSEDSRLVGEVTFTDDSKLSFTLAGGPRGDPGLNFERVP